MNNISLLNGLFGTGKTHHSYLTNLPRSRSKSKSKSRSKSRSKSKSKETFIERRPSKKKTTRNIAETTVEQPKKQTKQTKQPPLKQMPTKSVPSDDENLGVTSTDVDVINTVLEKLSTSDLNDKIDLKIEIQDTSEVNEIDLDSSNFVDIFDMNVDISDENEKFFLMANETDEFFYGDSEDIINRESNEDVD